MSFKLKEFMREDFRFREQRVPVPGMATWFEGGKKNAYFTVRGLTAAELARVQDAGAMIKNMEAAVEALSGSKQDKIEAVSAMLGLTKDVTENHARSIEMVCLGLVDPKLERAEVVKLGEAYGIEFLQLARVITALTGQGKTWGKSNGSGESPTSEPLSHSPNIETVSSSKSDPISSLKDT